MLEEGVVAAEETSAVAELGAAEEPGCPRPECVGVREEARLAGMVEAVQQEEGAVAAVAAAEEDHVAKVQAVARASLAGVEADDVAGGAVCGEAEADLQGHHW